MRYTILTFFVSAFLTLPFSAFAEIRINEIAWMGGNGNANCEWIELYNDSDTEVDIAGWSFMVNTTKNATLLGNPGELIIEPYGYYVIARKFSTTAASATTCHPYFESFGNVYLGGIGSLNNTALSISLFDPTSVEPIDSVTATNVNWSEYSKANTGNYDTVQRSGATWSLGTPTPAAPNTATVPSATQTTNTAAYTTVTTAWDKDQIRQLSIVAPDTLHAGVPFTFTSITSPKDSRKYKSHLWNFGDFTTSKLSSPTHTYAKPGTYLIHLTVDGDTPLILTKTITVIAPSIIATRLLNGDFEIINNGTTPLDLSNFTIVGSTTFTIPQHSTILAGARITIPKHLVPDGRGIVNPQGDLIAAAIDTPPQIPPPPRTSPYTGAASFAEPAPFAPTLPEPEDVSSTSMELPPSKLPQLSATNTANATSTSFPAYLTLGILLVVAVGASLIKTKLQ
ncbi:hypothetical protein A3C87_02595 [Candidatus Kaiserbacteria bacterium RIFCSPHIGHO2_02_FULL_49_34]|uniref:PKD domain-containing protein n=1 Tax=Candidatus Kaiserbacteria bacterium RIFCSPHIGHO2_02_FULL_49_34 TaxID=1798491 RepID=A0A1F6DJE9_9BACT|nr:MAG: hypothetical protein A3C87_02595 [Candidatus Kaiserbacteria bacterium RIFCSPHIGHO2_02_FULL_49_34]